ncbi:glutathione S-transferase [Phyllosticta citrichinensis]
MPPITLYFLQSSRSIRTAWLLEELSLDYDVKFSGRMADGRASQEDRDAVGTAMGKFPTIKDGDDVSHRLIPSDPALRIKALEWLHAAEATFALHSLAIVYARWYYPKEAPAEGLEQMEASMSKNVKNDFGWLESELEKSLGGFLVGKEVTVADVMMQFGVRFIFEKELGTKRDRWPRTEEWLKRCEECEAYKRAVKKTGHVFS